MLWYYTFCTLLIVRIHILSLILKRQILRKFQKTKGEKEKAKAEQSSILKVLTGPSHSQSGLINYLSSMKQAINTNVRISQTLDLNFEGHSFTDC